MTAAGGRRARPRQGTARDLRRTSLYLDAQDRRYLARLASVLGITFSEVLRLALRTLAHKYGFTRSRKEGGR